MGVSMNERISLKLNMKDGTLDYEGPPKDLGEALQHVEKFLHAQVGQKPMLTHVATPSPHQIEMVVQPPPETKDLFSDTATTKAKSSKKAKPTFQMDKTLSLKPEGKVSAIDFAAEKAPSNGERKCLVAVYYLRSVLEMPQVTADRVYTFFKTVAWPVPADLKNVLQKAGSIGWLDTANSDDIKITPMGENEVEFNLTPKKAS